MKLAVGDKAPQFSAPDQDGALHSLVEYKGRWLVLYFYPKDDTPGCTKEACGLRDNIDKLSVLAAIVGVSADSVTSHKQFATKYNLPFTLLSDPERLIISAYGTDGLLFAKRTTFLIDPQGRINQIYEKVNPETHAAQIMGDLTRLRPKQP